MDSVSKEVKQHSKRKKGPSGQQTGSAAPEKKTVNKAGMLFASEGVPASTRAKKSTGNGDRCRPQMGLDLSLA